MFEYLTKTEISILQLVAEGYSNEEIGAKLGYAPTYIKKLVTIALSKIGAKNRPNAIYICLSEGILSCQSTTKDNV